MNLIVINSGKERASYSVAFDGHVDSNNAPIGISKRSMEVLKQMADLGKQFGGSTEILKTTISARLEGFPNGSDVLKYLDEQNLNIFEYIEDATKVLSTVGKTGGTGERAKRGQGHMTKANKFLASVMAKLTCRLAPASETGAITDEMLNEGFDKALASLQEVDKSEIVAAARKIAEKTGLDVTGYIRLRSENGKDEEATEEV